MLHARCIVFLLMTAASVRGSSAPIVTVSGGQVSGVTERSTEDHEFYAYYSIPFAKPPLGRLRLKDPEPADPWEGVLPGSSQPEPCVQVPLIETMLSDGAPNLTSGSEDCLYLNVFTPAEKETEDKLPVMVWIHGGGYFSGGAAEYPPEVLLNHDIVLVVLQYRLGVLGFLSTEDDVIPGNFGLKDQTLALQWVQENIHNFGGDASRVTIFGESAGGASVHFHILSPKSKGLFKRAIMQSGTFLASWAKSAKHLEVAKQTGDAMGCQDVSNSDALLECLQALDAKELVLFSQSLYKWLFFPMSMNPRVDGDYLPDDPEVLVRKGHFAHVDLLSGVTANEGVFFTNLIMNSEAIITSLNNNFTTNGPFSVGLDPEDSEALSIASKIYEYYLGRTSIGQGDDEELQKLFTDVFFVINHDLTCLFHARFAPTFRYSLDYNGDLSFGDFFRGQGSKGVSHCDDLYYLFRGGEFLQPSQQPAERPHDLVSEDDLTLRKIMTTTWTNFAATGNPTPDETLGFTWNSATSDDFVYLSLKPAPTMEDDKRKEVREFYASFDTRQNQILFLEEEEEEEEEEKKEEEEEEGEEVDTDEEEEEETEDEEEEGEVEEEGESEDEEGETEEEDDKEGEEEEPQTEEELPDAEVAFERQFNQDEL